MYKIVTYQDPMKAEVIAFILSILEGEFKYVGIERPDLWAIPSYYTKNNGNFWVAFEGDKVIGTVGLLQNSSNQGLIKRMCVDAAYRGKGLAQELLATLIDFAKTHGYENLYLYTSPNMLAAQKFYAKEGFIKVPALPDNFSGMPDSIFYKMSLK